MDEERAGDFDGEILVVRAAAATGCAIGAAFAVPVGTPKRVSFGGINECGGNVIDEVHKGPFDGEIAFIGVFVASKEGLGGVSAIDCS